MFFFQHSPVNADLWIVQGKCPANWVFFNENLINPNDYEKVLKPTYDMYPGLRSEGYCVRINEYCQKNKCDASLAIEHLSKENNLFLKAIGVNFILNGLIIFFIFLVSKATIKLLFELKSIIKLIVITVLGYFADLVSLQFLSFITSSCSFTNKWLCGSYKSTFAEKLTSPLSVSLLIPALILIFIIVFYIFYKFYSEIITFDRNKRIKYSIFFGIFSNPVWYFLFRIFLITNPFKI